MPGESDENWTGTSIVVLLEMIPQQQAPLLDRCLLCIDDGVQSDLSITRLTSGCFNTARISLRTSVEQINLSTIPDVPFNRPRVRMIPTFKAIHIRCSHEDLDKCASEAKRIKALISFQIQLNLFRETLNPGIYRDRLPHNIFYCRASNSFGVFTSG